jgi:hypothetical protein
MEKEFDKINGEFKKYNRDFDQKPVQVIKLGEPFIIASKSKEASAIEELMDPVEDRAVFLAMEVDVPFHIQEKIEEDGLLSAANGYIARRESSIRPIRDPTVTEILEGAAIPLVKHYYLHVQLVNYVLKKEKKTFRDEEILDMDSEF